MRKINLEKNNSEIKKRHIFVSWFFLFFFLLPLVFLIAVWVSYLPPSPFPLKDFEVKKGESVNQIAEKLKSDGYIKSTKLFKILALKYSDKVKKIQAGTYHFLPSDTVYDIF